MSWFIFFQQDFGDVYLLKNIEPILEELELHQVSFNFNDVLQTFVSSFGQTC